MITKIPIDSSQKSQWDAIAKTNPIQAPFFAWAWHDLWRQTLAHGWEQYPLLVNNKVIAPFAKKDDQIKFSGGEEISDYHDLIGPNDQKDVAWKELLPFLNNEGVRTINLRNIPEDSSTRSFFQSIAGARVQQEDTTPVMTLPDTWDAYIESLPYKNRHELERKLRKFQREHPNATLKKSDSPSSDIDILLSLMEKDEKKRDFLTPDMRKFFKEIVRVFKEDICVLVVWFDGTPAAATLSFVNAHTTYLYNSGYDKACCTNAGFYTKAMTIKHAIEAGRKTYNFLQGNERYKFELGGKDFGVYRAQYHL